MGIMEKKMETTIMGHTGFPPVQNRNWRNRRTKPYESNCLEPVKGSQRVRPLTNRIEWNRGLGEFRDIVPLR